MEIAQGRGKERREGGTVTFSIFNKSLDNGRKGNSHPTYVLGRKDKARRAVPNKCKLFFGEQETKKKKKEKQLDGIK